MTEEGPVVVAPATVRIFGKVGDPVECRFVEGSGLEECKVKKLAMFMAEVEETM